MSLIGRYQHFGAKAKPTTKANPWAIIENCSWLKICNDASALLSIEIEFLKSKYQEV